MIGAAGASVFSEIFVGISLYLVVKKYAKISVSFTASSKALFASLIMALVLWFMNSIPQFISFIIKKQAYIPALTSTHAALLFFSILTGGSIYTLTIILTKAISKETIQEILSVKKGV